jgi:hypothetical protein
MLWWLLASIAHSCPEPRPTNVSLGSKWCFAFGAVMRERYEFLGHPDWGARPTDGNGYLLHRLLAHADLTSSDDFRAFVELGGAGVYGAKHRERPTDRDWFDLHQAYLEVSLESLPITLRGGRQELSYGSSRLVSVREEANVRRRFDGIRAILRTGLVQTDAILLRPVETDPGVFDDEPERGQWLWGAHATLALSSTISLDLYYLGLRRPDAVFNRGTALEVRHSIGARVSGEWAGADYDFELDYQLGTFGEGRIAAWMIASDTGFTAEPLPTRPRIGLRVNITSGDRDPDDPDLETFNPFFPDGSYFGEASLIGPLNHIDLHPVLDLRPTDSMIVTLEWDFFWRERSTDAVYRASTTPVVRGDASRARYVGSQGAVKVEWEIDPLFSLAAAYVHFFAGRFLSESGHGRDIDFIASWLTWRI